MRGHIFLNRFYAMASVVILIPARFGSSRFPGKPLTLISGKSMVERVYTNCAASGFESAVVTDNDEIEKAVKAFGGKVVRVNDDVPSGSERIALAYERFYAHQKPDLVINVQGDEPLLKGDVLQKLAQFHLKSAFDITTLLRARNASEEDFKNPNVVKAIWSEVSGQCLYFSRQSLPFDREGGRDYQWYQHIGVYSYKPQALSAFVKLPLAKLEDLEKLEQLRALENQMTLGAILTTQKLIGVDVPEDVKKVEGALRE
jgi:3-deoxy-manno-octulosonate cytidylyltransferase (CMP-KDO synthetase)